MIYVIVIIGAMTGASMLLDAGIPQWLAIWLPGLFFGLAGALVINSQRR